MARTLNESLSRDSTPISVYSARLDELDRRPVFEVFRTRNGEVLTTMDTEAEASDYITENDYNPERVKVRTGGSSLFSDDNKAEVAGLRKIRDAVVAARGQDGWDNGSQSLYKLLPGSEVIEVGGERIVFLETLFPRR